MYHTKKIGVFISHIFGHYQKNVCQGIIDKALEYGYTAEIFTSLDGENLGTYGIGEESILRVPNYDSLEGVIFASETYLAPELRQKILTQLQTMCTCPIVEIAVNNYHFPTVSLENSVIVKDLTEHFIKVHNYKRICYLGCSAETFFSDQRESFYKETMAKHHMTVGTHDIYNSDYSKDSVQDALQFFCEEGTPEAVVCYNDRLALLFMENALTEGYKIPEDIALTGCDDTPEGQNISPMLSTISFPVYELGITAVENLISKIRGNEIPTVTTVTAKPLIHNSCGCKTNPDMNSVFFTHKLSKRITTLENSILNSMNMSATLQHVTDLDEGIDLLEEYIRKIERCREFYLCLYSDWDSVSSHILELTDSQEELVSNDNILLKLALKNGKRLPECSYQKKYLLPEYIYENSDCAYMYTPLFFGDKEFGYIALAFEGNRLAFHFQLIQWQININQMLQSICEAKRTGLLVTRLEDIYMKDSLTGLLNKHGYNHHEELLLNRAITENQPICAFLIDMNGLKSINDNFGHLEGDFAIQVLGHALESAAGENDICARFSGDEFYLLSLGKANNEAKSLIDKIQVYLENYNKLSNKEYTVSCSCGFASTLPDADFTSDNIQELFALADKMMYENKARYHAEHHK